MTIEVRGARHPVVSVGTNQIRGRDAFHAKQPGIGGRGDEDVGTRFAIAGLEAPMIDAGHADRVSVTSVAVPVGPVVDLATVAGRENVDRAEPAAAIGTPSCSAASNKRTRCTETASVIGPQLLLEMSIDWIRVPALKLPVGR